jgi:hypothetical protein
VVVA